jgi:hypothetical protein
VPAIDITLLSEFYEKVNVIGVPATPEVLKPVSIIRFTYIDEPDGDVEVSLPGVDPLPVCVFWQLWMMLNSKRRPDIRQAGANLFIIGLLRVLQCI